MWLYGVVDVGGMSGLFVETKSDIVEGGNPPSLLLYNFSPERMMLRRRSVGSGSKYIKPAASRDG